ncbi:universal stress protein [Spirulina major CS-329]|uniref:universal stress protein n=1 Tax=Spirulina TaxID=1154 RepID=UPI00232AA87C|nr:MULTISPECIES: universal stress protein [Spirulina]MDB9496801.1 universal stress protein [Spirulina subsalsa CS-330]MDB9501545.1 universal stress protein [Spirulina major CS-329]
MIKNVLLADSGIGNSRELFQSMQDLPAMQGVNVTILHVVPPQVSTEAMESKLATGDEILETATKTLNLDPHQVTTLKRQGEPKDTVCKVADEIDADLIIMGSRGLKRLESILENSVSQYVFQLANRPMLLVRDDIYVRKIKRIMVALDKSEKSQASLDFALFLANGAPGVELVVARVNPDLDPNFAPTTKAEIESNTVIAQALPKLNRMGVKYRCIVEGGKPGAQLCKLVEDQSIDLLILGSPDRRPSVARALPDLDRLLGTSLSDYVRVNANCPVLLVRQPGE